MSKPTIKVREARELPESSRDELRGAELIARITDGDPKSGYGFGRERWVQFKDGKFLAGKWQWVRPNASRITVDGDVYEGRVPNPGNALFAVMRLRENRGDADGAERDQSAKVLISYERIHGARHAKMTKVADADESAPASS